VTVDLCLLGGGKSSRPPSIIGATHPTGDSHQGGLGLQAAVGGASIGHIPRGIVLLEDAGVLMLQDQIRCDSVMKPVHPLIENRKAILVLLTTVVESFAFASSKVIWARGKLHAGDDPKGDHLRVKGTVGQSFLFCNSNLIHGAFTSAKQRNRLHLLLER